MPPMTVTVFAAPAGTFVLEDDGIFATRGITLRNFATVTIGGLSNAVDGRDVPNSGNIFLENFGTILLSKGRSLTSPNAGRSTACP